LTGSWRLTAPPTWTGTEAGLSRGRRVAVRGERCSGDEAGEVEAARGVVGGGFDVPPKRGDDVDGRAATGLLEASLNDALTSPKKFVIAGPSVRF